MCMFLFLGCEEDSNTREEENQTQKENQIQTETSRTIILTDSDNGSAQTINIGDTLQIELTENGSVGHRFTNELYNTSILTLTGTDYLLDPATEGLDGAASTKRYWFEGTMSGETLLEIAAEIVVSGTSLLETFAIDVIVE